jgi:hypothetical protein
VQSTCRVAFPVVLGAADTETVWHPAPSAAMQCGCNGRGGVSTPRSKPTAMHAAELSTLAHGSRTLGSARVPVCPHVWSATAVGSDRQSVVRHSDPDCVIAKLYD